MVVLERAVGGVAGEVDGVDLEELADLHGETGLLVHLADDGVARVLPVVDAAAGKRPATGPARCGPTSWASSTASSRRQTA